MRLKDKVAIVTGGGVGIGIAISLVFAKERADVVLACPFLSELEPTATEIGALGRKALAVVIDVSYEKQVQEAAVFLASNEAGGLTGQAINVGVGIVME